MPTGLRLAGLTGSFGSGKSTVAGLFAELGARVVDADRLAHEALEPASPVFAALEKEFPEALAQGGGFDRKKLAGIVFNDAQKRGRLEALIHPYVFRRIEEEIEKSPKDGLMVLEVPLLFETGYHLQCGKTIFVDAAPETIERRLEKRGFSREEIVKRTAAQMPAGEKKRKADFTVCNNETIEKTREEVRRVFHRLVSERKGA